MPTLYPGASQFRDLSGDDAVTLIAFYDSLDSLEKFVGDWWERDGQLPVNIFNMIMTLSNKSQIHAENCIKRFDLETFFPLGFNFRNQVQGMQWMHTWQEQKHAANSSLP